MQNHQKEKQRYKLENGKFGIIECQAREIKMWKFSKVKSKLKRTKKNQN